MTSCEGSCTEPLFGEAGAPEGGALAGTVVRFERLAAEADQLSDEARADAARVGEQAVETRNLALARQQAAAMQGRLVAVEKGGREAAEEWRGPVGRPRAHARHAG